MITYIFGGTYDCFAKLLLLFLFSAINKVKFRHSRAAGAKVGGNDGNGPKVTLPTTDSADVEEGHDVVARSHWWRLERSEILRPRVSMAPLDWIPVIGGRW